MRVGADGQVPAAVPARGELTPVVTPGSVPTGCTALRRGAERQRHIRRGRRARGSPEDVFKLTVRGSGGKVEEFDDLTTKRGRQNAMTVVNARSKLIRLEETAPAAEPATAERGDHLPCRRRGAR